MTSALLQSLPQDPLILSLAQARTHLRSPQALPSEFGKDRILHNLLASVREVIKRNPWDKTMVHQYGPDWSAPRRRRDTDHAQAKQIQTQVVPSPEMVLAALDAADELGRSLTATYLRAIVTRVIGLRTAKQRGTEAARSTNLRAVALFERVLSEPSSTTMASGSESAIADAMLYDLGGDAHTAALRSHERCPEWLYTNVILLITCGDHPQMMEHLCNHMRAHWNGALLRQSLSHVNPPPSAPEPLRERIQALMQLD